jgi:ACR3 family arsenite efflux pump ArsB
MPLTISVVFVNLLVAIVLVPIYLATAINKLNLLFEQTAGQACVAEQVTNGAVNCLFGNSGGVSPLKIALPILFIVIIPLILAYMTQQQLKHKYGQEAFSKIKQQFAAASNLGMLVVLFVLMGIKNNIVIFEHPEYILKAILPLLLFYISNLLISWQLKKMIGGAEGRAMFWGTYLRYVTLALGLSISLVYQNPAYNLAVIVVVMAYLIQIPSSFWLAKKLS